MDKIIRFCEGNMTWIIMTLISIGVYITTLTYQGKQLDILSSKVDSLDDNKVLIATLATKFDSMERDIKEIKVDLREVRNAVYKPTVTNTKKESTVIAYEPSIR